MSPSKDSEGRDSFSYFNRKTSVLKPILANLICLDT